MFGYQGSGYTELSLSSCKWHASIGGYFPLFFFQSLSNTYLRRLVESVFTNAQGGGGGGGGAVMPGKSTVTSSTYIKHKKP